MNSVKTQNELADKVAIITGASSGIGYAAAKLFAGAGAKVVVTARRRERLEALVDEIQAQGGAAVAVAGDVTDEALVESLVRTAVTRFGGLDVAFNNVGAVGDMAPVPELSLDSWRRTLDVNLTSAFLCAKYQVPAMMQRGGGSLVFTSSFVGQGVGMPNLASYAAAKAGLIGLVQTLAVECGGQGIRANALIVGGTDTPANVANAEGAGPEVRTFVENLHALRRMAAPEEIARCALYLASSAASFITGAGLYADGGVSITRT